MGVNQRNNTVTNGLVIYYDVANPLVNIAGPFNNMAGSDPTALPCTGVSYPSSYRYTSVGPTLFCNANNNFLIVQNTTGSFTFAGTGMTSNVWINIAQLTSTSVSKGRAIIHKDNNNFANGWYIHTASGSTAYHINMHILGGGTTYQKGVLAPPINTWFNLTVTWDGFFSSISSSRIYYNGVEQSSSIYVPSTGTIGSDAIREIQLFQDGAGQDATFSGSFALVQFYNRPLSSAEVMQNFNTHRSRFNL